MFSIPQNSVRGKSKHTLRLILKKKPLLLNTISNPAAVTPSPNGIFEKNHIFLNFCSCIFLYSLFADISIRDQYTFTEKCSLSVIWGKSLLLNFMETVEWEDNSSHTYTYIALYDGGTYISQHSGIDYNDSTMLWLDYFIRTPYLNDSQKEILASNFARHLSSFIEESCNFRILRIILCHKQLDLYIAKTKIDDNVKIRSNEK